MAANSLLTNKKPEKRLLLFLNKKGGRSFSGRITIRHRGGGVKRMYRLVDYGQEKLGVLGKVVALEYDPNRPAYLALIAYQDGDKRYVIAPKDLKIGDEVICQLSGGEVKTGNRLKLKSIPVGNLVFNVEMEPGQGGKMIRGAGAFSEVVAQEGEFTHLELPSKEIKKFSNDCFATVGQVSHAEYRFEKIGKAGRRRLKGWRPSVRGVAMNPPDHPHGGGEGRSSIGMKYPKTPWGKHALGVKTRNPKKWTNKFIIKRKT